MCRCCHDIGDQDHALGAGKSLATVADMYRAYEGKAVGNLWHFGPGRHGIGFNLGCASMGNDRRTFTIVDV